jgi:glucose-1-phosphate adenylyltransferase
MPGAYLQAHLDLLDAEPPLDLDDPRWPILTHGVQRLPARVERTAAVAQSLIAPGCRVHGLVERAVLGPGVVIEEGADVRDAVVFENTIIRAGAKVACAILDSEVVVGPGAQVGADGAFDGDEAGEKLVVVGRGAQIAAGAKVAPGERVEVGAQRDAGERAVGAAKGDA